MTNLFIERLLWIAIAGLGYAGFLGLLWQNRRLKNLITTDPLTNVHNRRGFEEELKRAFSLSQRKQRQLAILMIDLDHFKKFNDTYGHPAGDKLLQQFAHLLGGELRDSDVLARYGGEEFAAILPETDPKEAAEVAERIRGAVESTLNTTVSIGVAAFPADAGSREDLVQKADAALYQAKEKRNTVVVSVT